ncbi:addiction module antidote protein [Stenotrophomonas maltophilia]|uniref:addiction module antidote protein n=1 Tax=Stenotrophomonas maltophilia TaxID=40324 RepID=UPI0013DBCC09|nr:addiction module antidote protein [Stenotrophomonas maltophilia]
MSKLKTIPFDPTDYLDDDIAIASYLSEALAAGDPDHFQEALGTVARARGMSGVAEVSGLGRESLYKALRPGAHPRFDTVQRVLSALGVHLIVQADKQPAGTA